MAIRVLAPKLTLAAAASLPSFAFTVAVVLVVCAIGAALLMPTRTPLLRDIRGEDDPPLGYPLMLLLVILCAIAMLQVPVVMNWWREEWALVRSVLPEGPDPLGLSLVPIAVALCLPVLTAMTVGLFAVTSLLAIVAPSKLAFRVIAASVLLQLGYISTIFLTNTEMHTIASALVPVVSGDADASRMLADWMHRHDAALAHALPSIAWTSVGYLFAVGVAYVTPKRAEARTPSGPSIVTDVVQSTTVAAPLGFHTSAASAAIDESNYSVHPRMTLMESWFTRKCTTFEIRTIPHKSRKWFSFSWATGVLRQEPEGLDLVTLTPPRAPGLFVDRRYDVIDSRTSETLARFEPRGDDWEIVHESGDVLGRILHESSVRGFVKYRAFVGDQEVVRYKWALAGLSTSSAELEVEFLSSPAGERPLLDRILALAIAPILEQRARLAHEPKN